MISDLREYLYYLQGKGRLVTIKEPVDSELEVTAFTDKASRADPYNGKTLVFTNVKGSEMPVVTNLFGSLSTLNELFGANYLRELLVNINAIKSQSKGISLLKGAKMMRDAKPKVIGSRLSGYKKLEGLNRLPLLKSWPKDAGKFITLPLVVSNSPKDGSTNVGIYRMQVFDDKTTGMHWQSQKGGAIHAQEAQESGGQLNLSVVLGTDPANILAAATPLPVGMNEFSFAGVMRGSRTVLMKNGKYPMVPANAEIVINGHVDPDEKRMEGPFGDHTGYYSIAEPYHVFHIDEIYAKKNAVYPASVVGKPWHEDAVIFQFMFEFLKPVIKSMNESIVDIYLPPEGIFTSMCFVSIKKRFPGQAKRAMFTILGMGQLSVMKYIAVFDDDIDIKDMKSVIWALATRVEPKRDIQIIEGAVADSLDHATDVPSLGSKILIDATKKTKGDGYKREWPDTISLPEDLVKEVDKKWESLKS